MTSAEYCKIAVKALEDKKAEDVKVHRSQIFLSLQME